METENFKYEDSRSYTQSLSIRIYVLLGIPLLIFAVHYLRWINERPDSLFDEQMTQVIVIVGMLAAFAITLYAYFTFKNAIKKGLQCQDLKEKLLVYRKESLTKFNWLFIASMIVTLGFITTSSEVFAAGFGVMIILFSTGHPNKLNISTTLKFTKAEQKSFLKDIPFDDPSFGKTESD